MAWAAALGTFIVQASPYIVAAASAYTAYATYQQGQAQEAAAEGYADQLEARANQERALAQMEAQRRKRQGKAQLSEQRSLLADSGFAADDPSSLHLVSETIGAQTLEELLVLAQGEDAARQTEFEAQQARSGGRQAARGATIAAGAGLASDTASWYDRYGSSLTKRTRTPSGGKPSGRTSSSGKAAYGWG